MGTYVGPLVQPPAVLPAPGQGGCVSVWPGPGNPLGDLLQPQVSFHRVSVGADSVLPSAMGSCAPLSTTGNVQSRTCATGYCFREPAVFVLHVSDPPCSGPFLR